MDTERFEQLVAKAVESLPEEILGMMENVDVIVAEKPTKEQLRYEGIARGETLLGLYEGVPLTQRTFGYTGMMPDKITIFQKPIEAVCRNDNQVVGEVQRVVRHEIAHHFGIDDDRLEELGKY